MGAVIPQRAVEATSVRFLLIVVGTRTRTRSCATRCKEQEDYEYIAEKQCSHGIRRDVERFHYGCSSAAKGACTAADEDKFVYAYHGEGYDYIVGQIGCHSAQQ